ncbi:MAG: M64 family metallopeptidase [Rikenellaceae bacterium]
MNMKRLWTLFFCALVMGLTSCVDNSELDGAAVGKTVDLYSNIAEDVVSRTPLTDQEKNITHFYALLVGNDDVVLRHIARDVTSSDSFIIKWTNLPTNKFPVTIHVFANLKCEGFHSPNSFAMSPNAYGFFSDDTEFLNAARTGKAIGELGVIHLSGMRGPGYQDKNLPKVGKLRVELSQASTPLSISISNLVAKIDIANTNSLALQSLSVRPRVKFYRFNESVTPFDHVTETASIHYPEDKLSSRAMSVYMLPGKGNDAILKSGVDYTMNNGKAMTLPLPLTLLPGTRYSRSLSAFGISVVVPDVANPEDGVTLLNDSGTLTVEVDADVPYTLTLSGGWLAEQPVRSDGLTKKIHTFTYAQRDMIEQATITVRDGNGTFKKVIPVTYSPRDGKVEKIFIGKHLPKKLPIIFVGDGFRPVDNRPGGAYDIKVKEVMDRIFSYSPFTQYKDYFVVYQVYANSVDVGADCDESASHNMNNQKNTVFNSTFWTSGVQRLLTMQDQYKVESYIKQIGLLSDEPKIVVGLVNSPIYGGAGGRYAVSSCNFSAPLIAIHEIGHVFSLADEYVDAYMANLLGITPISADSYPNVDKTNDKTKIKWKHLFPHYPKSDVDVQEGGLYLRLGIWRASLLSMMNGLNGNFNAISRETIVKKIMDWCGEPYNFETFLSKDKAASRSVQPMPPVVGLPGATLPMPVPLELYVKPSDMPSEMTRHWGSRH